MAGKRTLAEDEPKQPPRGELVLSGAGYALLYAVLTFGVCVLFDLKNESLASEGGGPYSSFTPAGVERLLDDSARMGKIYRIMIVSFIGSVFYLFLNEVFSVAIPHVPGTMIDGYPRWRWWLAAFGEAVILNGCMVLAYIEAKRMGWSFYDWIHKDSAELQSHGLMASTIYNACLYGSMTRDMLPPPPGCPTKLAAHHYAVMVCSVMFHYMSGNSANYFVFCSWIMEQGSMIYNTFTLYPNNRALLNLYLVSMTLSNAGGVLGAYLYLFTGAQLYLMIAVCSTSVLVSIGRQLHAIGELKAYSQKQSKKSK